MNCLNWFISLLLSSLNSLIFFFFFYCETAAKEHFLLDSCYLSDCQRLT